MWRLRQTPLTAKLGLQISFTRLSWLPVDIPKTFWFHERGTANRCASVPDTIASSDYCLACIVDMLWCVPAVVIGER